MITQGLDITLAHTTTATTAKTKNVSINPTGVIQCGGIAHYGKVVNDMRCIDADALIKALVRKEPFSDCARVVIAECMGEIRHAPTIEPERKSGHWIIYTVSMLDGEDCKCSECGQTSCAPYWNFCPNCGEKMEGVRTDEGD